MHVCTQIFLKKGQVSEYIAAAFIMTFPYFPTFHHMFRFGVNAAYQAICISNQVSIHFSLCVCVCVYVLQGHLNRKYNFPF